MEPLSWLTPDHQRSLVLVFPTKSEILRILGLAILFSMMDSSTSASMIFFRGIGFEANIEVHQIYPTFGAISPLIVSPIEMAVVFIGSIATLYGAQLAQHTFTKTHVMTALLLGLGDFILLSPIILGAVGNVAATITGNVAIIDTPYIIFTNEVQAVLFLRNFIYRKSILAGDWAPK